MAEPLPFHLCLAGPTAAGKTAAALAIAARHDCEIISVDSALVYRGMDIGTAKPSRAERAQVPHHLIDILEPSEHYSAAAFVRDASALIRAIHARGKLPLLVGGTMLYFKALHEGLDAMPAADTTVRAAIEAQAAERGWPALHAELARHDAPTAARLAPADSQRIQRALEVWQLTGRPLSSFHTTKTIATTPYSIRLGALFSLEPGDRAWLHAHIDLRLQAMEQAGFLDEVRRLRARPDLHLDLPSMRCVGYRQAWEALAGTYPLESWRERALVATRQLAKRQITWLRSMPQRQAFACDQPDALAQLLEAVERALQQVHAG